MSVRAFELYHEKTAVVSFLWHRVAFWLRYAVVRSCLLGDIFRPFSPLFCNIAALFDTHVHSKLTIAFLIASEISLTQIMWESLFFLICFKYFLCSTRFAVSAGVLISLATINWLSLYVLSTSSETSSDFCQGVSGNDETLTCSFRCHCMRRILLPFTRFTSCRSKVRSAYYRDYLFIYHRSLSTRDKNINITKFIPKLTKVDNYPLSGNEKEQSVNKFFFFFWFWTNVVWCFALLS